MDTEILLGTIIIDLYNDIQLSHRYFGEFYVGYYTKTDTNDVSLTTLWGAVQTYDTFGSGNTDDLEKCVLVVDKQFKDTACTKKKKAICFDKPNSGIEMYTLVP